MDDRSKPSRWDRAFLSSFVFGFATMCVSVWYAVDHRSVPLAVGGLAAGVAIFFLGMLVQNRDERPRIGDLEVPRANARDRD